MAKRGRAISRQALNENRALKIDSWKKTGDETNFRGEPKTVWGEELVGFLDRNDNHLALVKFGSIGSPYEERKLHEANSLKKAGSKLIFLSHEEARDWISENDLSEERLANFLEIHEGIVELRGE